MRFRASLAALAGVLLLAACGGDPAGLPQREGSHHTPAAAASSATSSGSATTTAAKPVALRTSERFLELRMPTAYTPSAPSGKGTDEYRCFLLDPKLAQDSVITGTNFLPANAKLVHHVILYKVEPKDVAKAQAKDTADKGEGWTCFGGTGLTRNAGQNLDEAPWLGAWAPGASERVTEKGIGTELPKGSQIIMQIHYNLLGGKGSDQSAARLRIAPDTGNYNYLRTMLLPAPVELPCRPGVANRLCDRNAAMADLGERFGLEAATADLLHILCGAEPVGPTQKCTRPVNQSIVVRALSGHMHLLGRKISVVANAGTPNAQTLLDITNWDFDNQAATVLPKPVTLKPTDTLTVQCTHDQSFRDVLPALADIPERYVVWGEGTSDEMCLGIVMFTES